MILIGPRDLPRSVLETFRLMTSDFVRPKFTRPQSESRLNFNSPNWYSPKKLQIRSTIAGLSLRLLSISPDDTHSPFKNRINASSSIDSTSVSASVWIDSTNVPVCRRVGVNWSLKFLRLAQTQLVKGKACQSLTKYNRNNASMEKIGLDMIIQPGLRPYGYLSSLTFKLRIGSLSISTSQSLHNHWANSYNHWINRHNESIAINRQNESIAISRQTESITPHYESITPHFASIVEIHHRITFFCTKDTTQNTSDTKKCEHDSESPICLTNSFRSDITNS